jgi:hypothetical protein
MSITDTLLDIHRNYQSCMGGNDCEELFKLFNRLQGEIAKDFNNIITQWNTEANVLDKSLPNNIYTILNQLQTREVIMDINDFPFRGRIKAWPTILLDIYNNPLTTDELEIYKPPCYYGTDCYRKNNNHTHRFSHKTTRGVRTKPIGKKTRRKPLCIHGRRCYSKNKNHTNKYNHTHRFSHTKNHTKPGGSKKKKKRLNRKSKKTNLKR